MLQSARHRVQKDRHGSFLTSRPRLKFEWRYLVGRVPWDSGETPPELLEFLDNHPPGRAVDLGCGTGTNTLELAERGWVVTAYDISAIAIARARAKLARSGVGAQIERQDLTTVELPSAAFDLAVDIGCYHALNPDDRPRYTTQVAESLKLDGTYLLYSFLGPPHGELRWPREGETIALLSDQLELRKVERGEFRERPSAWFYWERRSR